MGLQGEMIVAGFVMLRLHQGFGQLGADDFLRLDQLVLVSAVLRSRFSLAAVMASSVAW